MIKLDPQSRKPIYEQLKEQILRLALLGALSPEDKLPSVRSLAREVGINPNTVQKAYQELEREGLLYTVAGKGSFVSLSDQGLSQRRAQALEELAVQVKQAQRLGCSRQEILDRAAKALEEDENHD